MTRRGPAYFVMSGRHRAVSRQPVLARPGSCALISGRPALARLAAVGVAFPGSAFFKPAVGRSCGPRQAPQSLRPQHATTGRSPCRRPPAHPPYLYLLEWPAAQPGSFDPGRDMLCILTSPQWHQWP